MPWTSIAHKMAVARIRCINWPNEGDMRVLGTFAGDDLKTHHWRLLYNCIHASDPSEALQFEKVDHGS
jgi:hypothetical protein